MQNRAGISLGAIMKRTALILAVALSGCTTTMVFTKPGATDSDLNTDFYQCKMQAYNLPENGNPQMAVYAAAMRERFVQDCMASKGWNREKR